MTELAELRIAVVGLGLMGGSLCGALHGRCKEVIGVARRYETIEIARARGLIDRGTTNLSEGVRLADLVVLATPARVILELLREIGSMLIPGCLLMDLGSTKSSIVAQMATLPLHIQPLGGHPMCGSEASGIEAAVPHLYHGCTFILSPLERTSESALALGRSLVDTIGAHPLLLEAEQHDRLVALASHLPYLLACAVVSTVGEAATAEPVLWRITASGFRDTSRLAGSDVTMMLDILLTNREAVLEAARGCEKQLRRLIGLVERADEQELRTTLLAIRRQRANARLPVS